MATTEQLRAIPWLAALDQATLGVLAVHLATQHFQRGEPIFHQGSMGSMLYLITEGQVRIFTVSEGGQELSVTIFRQGEFFGELALLDGLPRSASAVAMHRTTALLLHRAAFLRAVADHPQLAVSVLEALALRLRQSTSHADMLGTSSASQRVIRQILIFAERYGGQEHSANGIELRLTQDDLASLAGTTRETVNRVLATLRDQRLIRIGRGQVIVLDMMSLARRTGARD